MIKWFSPSKYYDPTDYEAWFERLALQGYHPRIAPYSFLAMRFERGPTRRYRYVVDVQAFLKAEYIPTYQSFGWELVGKMASMYIWRREYADERPEAFSDREGVLKRNARIAKAMTFSTVASFVTSVALWIGFAAMLPEDNGGEALFMGAFAGAMFLAGVLLLCLSIRILRSRA